VAGSCLSLVLVSAVRILFSPVGLPQAQWLNQRTEAPVISRNTKSLLVAGSVIVLSAVFQALLGFRPGYVGMVIVVVIGALQHSRSRKE
jgi:hypothetical protein